MPHVEYSDYGLIDFKIETYPELTKEQKHSLLRAFKTTGFVGWFSQPGKWMLFTLENTREATEQEIADLPKLPESWETYAYFERVQQ